jgi:hypothetical protein
VVFQNVLYGAALTWGTDIFINQFCFLYIIHVSALDIFIKQVVRVIHILERVTIENYLKPWHGHKHVSVVQHFSPSCRAARLEQNANLQSANLLKRLDDADMALCHDIKRSQISVYYLFAIGIPTLFGVFSSRLQELFFDVSVNAFSSALILFNAALFSISLYLLIFVNFFFVICVIYHFMVVKRNRNLRISKPIAFGTEEYSRHSGWIRSLKAIHLRSYSPMKIIMNIFQYLYVLFTPTEHNMRYETLIWRNMNQLLHVKSSMESASSSSLSTSFERKYSICQDSSIYAISAASKIRNFHDIATLTSPKIRAKQSLDGIRSQSSPPCSIPEEIALMRVVPKTEKRTFLSYILNPPDLGKSRLWIGSENSIKAYTYDDSTLEVSRNVPENIQNGVEVYNQNDFDALTLQTVSSKGSSYRKRRSKSISKWIDTRVKSSHDNLISILGCQQYKNIRGEKSKFGQQEINELSQSMYNTFHIAQASKEISEIEYLHRASKSILAFMTHKPEETSEGKADSGDSEKSDQENSEADLSLPIFLDWLQATDILTLQPVAEKTKVNSGIVTTAP